MKKLFTSTSQTVNYETGEIEVQNKVSVVTKKMKPFVRWYYDDLGSLFQLSSSAKDVLWLIVTRMNSENKIALDKDEINTLVKLSESFTHIKLKNQIYLSQSI